MIGLKGMELTVKYISKWNSEVIKRQGELGAGEIITDKYHGSNGGEWEG